jgi:transcriptional regulator with XRE-family HTH domain
VSELGDLLRAWRDRLPPGEAGLPAGAGRRAPGLRREELAALAGVSVEYLVRLEQGRSAHPSAQLLSGLARALRLSEAERRHLFRIGGVGEIPRGAVPTHISPGVQRMLDRLDDAPLAVLTASWDLLRWNRLWAAISGDPSSLRGLDRNVAWRHFTGQPSVIEFDDEHREQFSDDLAADLREASGRYPDDPGLSRLVVRLREESADFAARWERAVVARHRASRKTATRTAAGQIEIDCDVLTVPDNDLRLVVYTAVPGSIDADRLRLLSVSAVASSTPAASGTR